jgi:hypothetical protein
MGLDFAEARQPVAIGARFGDEAHLFARRGALRARLLRAVYTHKHLLDGLTRAQIGTPKFGRLAAHFRDDANRGDHYQRRAALLSHLRLQEVGSIPLLGQVHILREDPFGIAPADGRVP